MVMFQRVHNFDLLLLVSVLTLLGIGIVMIYSSSAIVAGERFEDPNRFLVRQIVWALLGLCALGLFLHIDYHHLVVPIYIGLLVCFLGLLLVLIPEFSVEVNGARRWLKLGFMNFQPSELAKLLLTLYFAYVLTRKRERVEDFKFTVLPLFVVASFFVVPILLEPDLGTVIIIGFILFTMLFCAGGRLLHFFITGILTVPVLFAFIWNVPYRKKRWLAFLDPESDPLDTGFHIIQSKIAIGSGGLTGQGLGQGLQKLHYLPESHTDFIFSVLCEEVGFIGAMIVVALFVLLVIRGIRIALRTQDLLGCMIACGITLLIGLQAFINIAVVMGMFPTKGLALPFISSGGSSLFCNLAAMGILLNVSAKRDMMFTLPPTRSGPVSA